MDSGALALLNRAFALAGQPSGQTTLLDADVTQTVDVGPIARRSLAPQGGLFYATVRIKHTAVGGLCSSFNVYEPYHATPGSLAHNGWPAVVPAGFDVWLIEAVATTDDATDFLSFSLDMALPGNVQGISLLNTAGTRSSPAPGEEAFPLAFWDGVVTAKAGITYLTNPDGLFITRLNQRVRRGTVCNVCSVSDSTGTVENTLVISMGLFPVCLGQDASF